MFGGHCHAEEFVDIRPTSSGKDASVDYDASELMGFHDDIDEVVYSAALEVFRANIVLYNVSQDSCRVLLFCPFLNFNPSTLAPYASIATP